ncbi:MAG: hypothetical protein EXS36_12195 [Pedosphaera sp.]|nr:hypothetical protein [Pedosphaera sp.]
MTRTGTLVAVPNAFLATIEYLPLWLVRRLARDRHGLDLPRQVRAVELPLECREWAAEHGCAQSQAAADGRWCMPTAECMVAAGGEWIMDTTAAALVKKPTELIAISR